MAKVPFYRKGSLKRNGRNNYEKGFRLYGPGWSRLTKKDPFPKNKKDAPAPSPPVTLGDVWPKEKE